MPDFPLKRLRPTYANLRKLMAEDAALPERENVTREINTRFKRHGIGDNYKINRGMPNVEPGTIMDFGNLGEYPHSYLERKRLPVPMRGIPDTLEPAFGSGVLKDNIELAREGAQMKDRDPTQHLIDILTAKDDFGVTNYAGGGSVTPTLEQWIRHRLPKKYARQDISQLSSQTDPRYDPWGGSSREIFSLGDNRLVKIAKRPRGLHEMSLEGDPRAAKNLPGLDWRSPDNELAVLERMPMTPDITRAVMEPMRERFEDMKLRSPLPPYRWHRDDKTMSNLVHNNGMDAFRPFNIHAADFFGVPDYHWTMRDVARAGPEAATLESRRGSEIFTKHVRPTLLDPGALDYRTNQPGFESKLAPSFRDVLDERLHGMMPKSLYAKPDELIDEAIRKGDIRPLEKYGIARGTEDFLGSNALFRPPELTPTGDLEQMVRKVVRRPMPTRGEDISTFGEGNPSRPPKLTGGMRRGGLVGDPRDLLKSARQHLAGGGVPRNWFRGKGSQVDKALFAMKSHRAVDVDNPVGGNMTPEGVADRAKRAALAKWIDTNVGNYIVKQHGTEGDPLKEIVGHPSAAQKYSASELFSKYFGQPGSEGATVPLKHPMTHEPPPWFMKLVEQDWPRHWSDSEYKRAMKLLSHRTDAMTEPSNVFDHSVESIAGVPNTDGTARVRKVAEYDQDGLEKKLAVYQPELARQKKLHDEKYQRRHAAPVELHDLASEKWEGYWAPEFRNTLDYLAQSDINPQDMHRVSVPDAVRKSREWHAALAKKAEEAKNAPTDLNVPWFAEHKRYPTGFSWQKYNPEGIPKASMFGERNAVLKSHEDSDAAHKGLSDALSAEGESMGHCVGSYCDDVLGGKTQIYSLRDPKGRPHVTVEVRPPERLSKQSLMLHPEGEKAWNEYVGQLNTSTKAGGDAKMMDFVRKNYPQILEGRPDNIVQIKGKGNAKPIDEYLPYVQDFVRSGKWGDVGDLKNTGLEKVQSYGPKGMGDPQWSRNDPRAHYMTPEEAAKSRRYNWSAKGERHDPDEQWLTEDDWIKTARSDPKWTGQFGSFSDDRLREQLRARRDGYRHEIPDDYVPPPIEFAKGGAVERDPGFPQESPAEQLQRAEHALDLLTKEWIQQPDPALEREIRRLETMIERLKLAAKGATLAQADSKGAPAAAAAGLTPPTFGEDDEHLQNDTLDMLHNFLNTGDALGQGDVLDKLMSS